jgi:hypothetical protein
MPIRVQPHASDLFILFLVNTSSFVPVQVGIFELVQKIFVWIRHFEILTITFELVPKYPLTPYSSTVLLPRKSRTSRKKDVTPISWLYVCSPVFVDLHEQFAFFVSNFWPFSPYAFTIKATLRISLSPCSNNK